MQKIKSLIIYGILTLLFVAAFGGYILSRNNSRSSISTELSNQINITSASSENTSQEAAASESAVTADMLAAKLLKHDVDISGKSEEEKQRHIKEIMKKSALEPEPNPIVGIGRGEDFSEVTKEAIENAGGLRDIIKKGDIVLIKPNLCVQTDNFGSPSTTDYRVVQEVVSISYECGASRVIIAEGNFASNAFENLGNRYAGIEGALLFNFNDCDKGDCYQLEPENSLVGWGIYIPKIYMDADVVIDVAKLKTHSITGVSLALKNNFGVPSYKIYGGGGNKSGIHSLGLNETIVTLSQIRKPDLSVIDGIIGGEGCGPTANLPVKSNIIIAGKDIAAVDTVALTFMGFKLDEIEHVKLAGEQKLGITDLKMIKVIGADLNTISMNFKRF